MARLFDPGAVQNLYIYSENPGVHRIMYIDIPIPVSSMNQNARPSRIVFKTYLSRRNFWGTSKPTEFVAPKISPPLSIGFTIVLSLQLDDPNALTRRTTVLLDDTRLEGHGFLEACGKLLWRVVGQGIFQANVHCCHLRQQHHEIVWIILCNTMRYTVYIIRPFAHIGII